MMKQASRKYRYGWWL